MICREIKKKAVIQMKKWHFCCLLGLFLIVFGISGCGNVDNDQVDTRAEIYREAHDCYVRKEYERAAELFDSLGHYKDAEEMHRSSVSLAEFDKRRKEALEILQPFVEQYEETKSSPANNYHASFSDSTSSSSKDSISSSGLESTHFTFKESTSFTETGMFNKMTDVPKGYGIKACGYVSSWKTFGIRFSANPDRFYVYFDFPESEYNKMLSASDPYQYYCDHIRGHYGTATKYPIPVEKATSNKIPTVIFEDPETGEEVEAIDIDNLTIGQAIDVFGEGSAELDEWLDAEVGMTYDEWHLYNEFGEDWEYYIDDY